MTPSKKHPVKYNKTPRIKLLAEAVENVAYWRRRAPLNPADKADCLARVSLWETTRDARQN